jgi:hypothetical protein
VFGLRRALLREVHLLTINNQSDNSMDLVEMEQTLVDADQVVPWN